jgi:hypothetical protein
MFVSQVEALASRPVGPVRPSHHSFNTRHPSASRAFLLRHVSSAKPIEPDDDVHEYGNGTCATLQWVQLTEDPLYQLHFVDNRQKREGPLTTAFMEDYLTTLHGEMQREDDFMGNRVGFAVKDVQEYRQRLRDDQVPMLDRNTSLLVLVPPGELILDIFEEE